MSLILTAGTTATGGNYMLILLVIMVVFLYFFQIRPDSKRRKQAEEMLKALSLGDEITTIGGLMGKIVQITEETVTFETGEDRVRIQIKRNSIRTTAKIEAAEAEAKNKKR